MEYGKITSILFDSVEFYKFFYIILSYLTEHGSKIISEFKSISYEAFRNRHIASKDSDVMFYSQPLSTFHPKKEGVMT